MAPQVPRHAPPHLATPRHAFPWRGRAAQCRLGDHTKSVFHLCGVSATQSHPHPNPSQAPLRPDLLVSQGATRALYRCGHIRLPHPLPPKGPDVR